MNPARFRLRPVAPGDKRAPMVRLLQDGTRPDGVVELQYDNQIMTFRRAVRMGLINDASRITPSGRAFLSKHAPAAPAAPPGHPAAVALGRLGGQAKSARKTAAARANGALGGWPKGRRRK